MQKEKLEEIKNMPKVVLHLHLDGSLRPETVYNWLKQGENNVTLEEVKEKLMVDKDCRDLNQYLQKFDLPLKVLQTEDHIEQATYELFEDLAKQNVIYAEVRFAPSLHTQDLKVRRYAAYCGWKTTKLMWKYCAPALRQLGFECDIAPNGKEALRMAM